MDLNLTMLGRILHAVANELAAMEQEAEVKETVPVSEIPESVVDETPVEDDMSRFTDIESAFQFQPEQPAVQEPVQPVATPAPVAPPAPVQPPAISTDMRIAQLEEQLRESRLQQSMASFNFQPININGETK